MPGQIRKSRIVQRGSTLRKVRPITRSLPSLPKVAPRVKTNVIRRSTNLNRAQNRIVKRQAVRAKVSETLPRPRPVVRPTSLPVKRMPKLPAPPAQVLKGMSKPVRPVGLPAAMPGTIRHSPISTAGIATAGIVTAGGLLALNAARAHPQISPEITTLQSNLTDLQTRSSFSEIAADLTNLDSDLNHALSLLESARKRGYVFQADLEDIIYQAMDRWQAIRAQVEAGITQQTSLFQSNMVDLNPQIQRLNSVIQDPTSASSYLSTTQKQVNQVLWNVEKAETALENSYEGFETDVNQLNARLTTIHWGLDQLSEAKFPLKKDEDFVLAVPARWDKEGKEDPEGIVYLTNRRFIYEQKEKVATKKVLFIATTSELVQKVLLDQDLSTVGEVTAKNKGVFGHQDFLDIQFSAGNLGSVSFHLNGQDSSKWVNLIKRTQSGQIEEDRTTGSGLAYSDLTGPLTSADLVKVQNEVNDLQDEMMLKDVQSELAELENQAHSLDRDLAALRAKGYAVEKNLEADIKILNAQWERIKSRAEAALEFQTHFLNQQMAGIQENLATLMGISQVGTVNLEAVRSQYIQLKSAIASAEAQADAAEDTVLDQFDEYADEVASLSAHFDWVSWMLAALSTASFQLLATECGVAATEAIWERPGLDSENGILFLTDQRILWEDRTGEIDLKISVPLQQVKNVKEEVSQDGKFEVLVFEFDSVDVPVTIARFQLALPVADDWLKMVGRARSGDYTQDRAIEIDEAQMDRIRNAPGQCPNCGAAFTAPVLRGQTDIICEFCGVATRL
jgi:predicted  nucleic acid-binding Zn-ribbon protein